MSSRFRLIAAFTLIELLTVIVIIAILALLIAPAAESARHIIEKSRCMNNMRSLHVSLSTYTRDRGHWPQCPYTLNNRKDFESWWFNELKDYGGASEVWQCPSAKRVFASPEIKEDDKPLLHYIPGQFDSKAFTPFKWSTQPWLIECGDFHGSGCLLIFPDGSIRSFNDFYQSQAGKK